MVVGFSLGCEGRDPLFFFGGGSCCGYSSARGGVQAFGEMLHPPALMRSFLLGVDVGVLAIILVYPRRVRLSPPPPSPCICRVCPEMCGVRVSCVCVCGSFEWDGVGRGTPARPAHVSEARV